MTMTMACAMVRRDQQVLLVAKPGWLRAAGQARSGVAQDSHDRCWGVPARAMGGHELVPECAERAVLTASGLTVKTRRGRGWGPGWTSARESGGRPSVGLWVACELPLEGEDQVLDESTRARWVDLDEVGELDLDLHLHEVFVGGWLKR